MKQLALILLFIPIGLFAQADQKDETLKKETDTEKNHSRMYLILEKKQIAIRILILIANYKIKRR